MKKGIFITGTDTGVGKTFIAKGLIRAFKDKNISVCPMKPVETGCRLKAGQLIPGDTMKLLNTSGVNEAVDDINPYRMRHPLAPSVAADIDGITIRKQKILSVYDRLVKKYDIVIVEGSGGIMVPVYKKYLFLDLAADMKLPVIIVARPGLGTINHTLLTIEAIRKRGLQILGIIINHQSSKRKGLAEKTNPREIQKIGDVAVLGIIPFAHASNHKSRLIFKSVVKSV